MKFLLAIDLETTGLEVGYNEVTEVGAVLLDNKLNILDEFQSYVRIDYPERGYERMIHTQDGLVDVFEYTGITPEQLAGAPKPNTVANKLVKFIKHRVKQDLKHHDICLLGQNTRFDYSMLETIFVKEPWIFDYHVISIDSIFTAWYFKKYGVLPEKVGQFQMCKEIGIVNMKEHDAMSDIKTTITILKYMLSEWNTDV